ncbi:MAG: 50S ribosomal protein L22 [Gemmatimonadota bacterium]|nr:50S ribosomal protein L22 [Gemmatimonadota bacterium]
MATKRAAKKAGREGATTPPARPAQPARKRVASADATGRQWHAVQRSTRQSPYKMRLVIDEIRGRPVNDALAYLAFSKKHAAKQIEKVLRSAVANAEYRTRDDGDAVDVDALYVKYAVINEGTKLKRFTPAAMGRATPIIKRTSHVEIVVAERGAR